MNAKFCLKKLEISFYRVVWSEVYFDNESFRRGSRVSSRRTDRHLIANAALNYVA